jgi:ketosteroid isomerase-like protein
MCCGTFLFYQHLKTKHAMNTKSLKIGLLILLVGFSKAFSQNAADEQYIRAARTASNIAIAKKDVAGVAKYWKDDYVEISSDGSLISGKEAIISDWKKMFEYDPSIRFERQLQEIEFDRTGMVLIEKGLLIYTSPNNYKGYYTALWRKVNGVWLTQMENFVSVL